jgi:prophage regulatory protein
MKKNLIRMEDVERCTTLSRREIYRRMKEGTFPRAVRMSRNVVVWVEEEIDRYVESKIASRDRAHSP